MVMRYFYTFFIYIYTLLIKCAALFNTKARLWVKGRHKIIDIISQRLKDETAPLVWFHASSLGEFEQGGPVIETLKRDYPHYKIVLTFFSPSGFEIRKNYNSADYIFYLPSDTMTHAKKFVSIVKPKIAIFIKYEFWFNYIHFLSLNRIPIFYISAIFRNGHYFFKFYGCWSLKQLQKAEYFFVQDNFSEEILQSHGISKVSVAGDTRFDRVVDITTSHQKLPLIECFKGKNLIFIAGSTWDKDVELIFKLSELMPPEIKFIIAPHLIDKSNLIKLKVLFGKSSCFYSELNIENASTYRTVIIDNIGMLSTLYSYGYVAYIGGGFGKGIHNILEAACYGLPVLFGPQYKKFREAHELKALKTAFSIKDCNELIQITHQLFDDKKFYADISEKNKNFVISHSGTVKKIMDRIKTYL